MATTRAEVRKENRVTARRDYGYSKDENINPRTHTKHDVKRPNANVHKDEHVIRGYSKIAMPPKKHLHSDMNYVNARKITPTISSQEGETERSPIKPQKLEVSKNNPDQESKRLSFLHLLKREKKKIQRNVIFFAQDAPKKWYTYSAEEYVRGNEEVDPVTSSAEWELEKRVEKMDVFSVDLDKDERGLGLSIIGLGVGTDTGVEKLGIFIKSLTEGGASEKDGRIQVNDQIIEVDGVSLVGVTQIFAAQTLKNTSGTVRY
ncbi:hypothetical protein QZH41_014402 [Actinostola sp. cb2023]|nr:hypothetical protein QZH41_014402 [Actinostola sp. cb2023]